MTDRELLELAAKAAGYTCLDQERGTLIIQDDEGHSTLWNPLTDDGDALRLAVKLGLGIRNDLYTDMVHVSCFEIGAVEVPYEQDMAAATRRAIVRAAAEIGRSVE